MPVTPIIEGLPPNTDRNNFTGSMGVRFLCSREIVVVALGRVIGDTFAESHTVKLWNENPTLEGSVVITPSSPVASGYAYEMLETPITLDSGSYYRIASTEVSGEDDWYSDSVAPNPVLSGSCSFTHGCYGSGASGAYPNFVNSSFYAWPNFFEAGSGGGSGGLGVSSLDPSTLKPCLIDASGNLKPGLTTSSYSGGTPSNASELKPGLVDSDGNLKPGLILGDGVKPGLLK